MIALITMQMHAANYLGERRRLGFDMRDTGYSVNSFARCHFSALRRHRFSA